MNNENAVRSLHVEKGITKRMPVLVKAGLSKMTPEQQAMFLEEYKRRRRSALFIFLLAIFFPIQHFLLGKAGVGFIFWLTVGGCGIWWFIEILLAVPRTRSFNNDVAIGIVRDLKIIEG